MATGLQGQSLVKQLSKTNKYTIRALTRNTSSDKAIELEKLPNVELFQGDLLNFQSLQQFFSKAYGIFGNTTPTKGNKPLVREYEIAQGKILIDAVKEVKTRGDLKHFIFSSICKAKDPLKNDPAPGHFSSKWDIENYLINNELKDITTIIRPASYFQNFNGNLPGLKITNTRFPGVVNSKNSWQTISAEDIGSWCAAIFSNPKRFLGEAINLATEEMTGEQMANLLQEIKGPNAKKVSYSMIPRFIMKLFVNDIGVMADWIERTGYGADIEKVKKIAKDENINMTSLESWLKQII